MTDKKLITICTEFRKGVLATKSPKDKCYMVVYPLASYLNLCGVDCKLEDGTIDLGDTCTNHFWIKLKDGRIIDPTADQFNDILKEQMPKVYLGQRPEHYLLNK